MRVLRRFGGMRVKMDAGFGMIENLMVGYGITGSGFVHFDRRNAG